MLEEIASVPQTARGRTNQSLMKVNLQHTKSIKSCKANYVGNGLRRPRARWIDGPNDVIDDIDSMTERRINEVSKRWRHLEQEDDDLMGQDVKAKINTASS